MKNFLFALALYLLGIPFIYVFVDFVDENVSTIVALYSAYCSVVFFFLRSYFKKHKQTKQVKVEKQIHELSKQIEEQSADLSEPIADLSEPIKITPEETIIQQKIQIDRLYVELKKTKEELLNIKDKQKIFTTADMKNHMRLEEKRNQIRQAKDELQLINIELQQAKDKLQQANNEILQANNYLRQIIYEISQKKKQLHVTTNNEGKINRIDDDSIIDITDQPSIILPDKKQKVPYWAHRYIYSVSEIDTASNNQKEFYQTFKSNFLEGEYIDLDGNTNYAFILLFDLLKEYEIQKDISKLESQLKTLGKLHPYTKSYGINSLLEKMSENNDEDGIWRVRSEENIFDNWKLGYRYKTKFQLSDSEIDFLNNISVSQTEFSKIPFFHFEIFKIFLSVIHQLSIYYDGKLDDKTKELAKRIAIEHHDNNEYFFADKLISAIQKEIYACIWKYCENCVRVVYKFNAFVDVLAAYYVNNAKDIMVELIERINTIIESTPLSSFEPINDELERKLNAINKNRWKTKFDELTGTYNENPKEFVDSIISLGATNEKNISCKNIFFEASKFIAKHNKESALILYIHYQYHDLGFLVPDNKQLPKSIQKILFKTDEQFQDFEKIVSELKTDKDLDKALHVIRNVYAVKRKKIILDPVAIQKTMEQHSKTVKILNEYLRDDSEDEKNETNPIVNNDTTHRQSFVTDLNLNTTQIDVLKFFEQNNFSVPIENMETYAKSRKLFKDYLIESINDVCFDLLDDVLIENDDDVYTINTTYFQKIKVAC